MEPIEIRQLAKRMVGLLGRGDNQWVYLTDILGQLGVGINELNNAINLLDGKGMIRYSKRGYSLTREGLRAYADEYLRLSGPPTEKDVGERSPSESYQLFQVPPRDGMIQSREYNSSIEHRAKRRDKKDVPSDKAIAKKILKVLIEVRKDVGPRGRAQINTIVNDLGLPGADVHRVIEEMAEAGDVFIDLSKGEAGISTACFFSKQRSLLSKTWDFANKPLVVTIIGVLVAALLAWKLSVADK